MIDNNTVGSVSLRVKTDSSGLKTELKKVGKQVASQLDIQTSSMMGKLNKQVASSAAGIGKSAAGIATTTVAAAVAAIGVILANAKKDIDEYNKQIEQETKLATIMQKRMNASKQDFQSMVSLTSKLQNSGVIGDDVLLAGAQQAATFLESTEALEKLMPAMGNLLAQQKGYNATASDAVSIGNLMGKVMQGQTSALRKVGITFTPEQEALLSNGTELQKAITLAEVINDNVGEMNSALAKTSEGRWANIKNQFGDVREKFGEAWAVLSQVLIPIAEHMLRTLNRIADGFTAFANTVAIALKQKTADDLRNASFTASSLSNIQDSAEETEGNTATAAKQLAGFDKLNNLSSSSSTSSVGKLNLSGIMAGILGAAEGTKAKHLEDLTGVEKYYKRLTDLGILMSSLSLKVGTFSEKVKVVIAYVGEQVSYGLKFVKESVKGFLDLAFTTMKAVNSTIGAFFINLTRAIIDPTYTIQDAWNDTKKTFEEGKTAINSSLTNWMTSIETLQTDHQARLAELDGQMKAIEQESQRERLQMFTDAYNEYVNVHHLVNQEALAQAMAFSGITTQMIAQNTNYVNSLIKTNGYLRSTIGELVTQINNVKAAFQTLTQNMMNNQRVLLGSPSAVVNNSSSSHYNNNLRHFATGAYVRANQPQLAVIGDNKQYGEFVAPENKLLDAVVNGVTIALQQSNQSSSPNNITIPVYLGNDKFDEVVVNASQRKSFRSGR